MMLSTRFALMKGRIPSNCNVTEHKDVDVVIKINVKPNKWHITVKTKL